MSVFGGIRDSGGFLWVCMCVLWVCGCILWVVGFALLFVVVGFGVSYSPRYPISLKRLASAAKFL